MRKEHLFLASAGLAIFVFLLLTADDQTAPVSARSGPPTPVASAPVSAPALLARAPSSSSLPTILSRASAPVYPAHERPALAARYRALVAAGSDSPVSAVSPMDGGMVPTETAGMPLPPPVAETVPEVPEVSAAAAWEPGNEVEALGGDRFRDRFGVYRSVRALVTAYCPCQRCCGVNARGITSTGTTAWRPGAAADPRRMAYGTQIYVPGYGLAVIDDTGGAMRQSHVRRNQLHLDMRMTYHYEARQWGRRYLYIRVYE